MESYDQPRQCIQKQRLYFVNKGLCSQGNGFSSGHVWMWELDYKESWALKNWCFWTVVLGKTLERPLDCKEIKPVYPKGDQAWVFFGRTDVEAETPILWPADVKSWLIGIDPDGGKDWGQEEKGMTEDKMVGWHHRLNGHGFGWTPGVGDGQWGLACCISWGHKESDTTEWMNWTELCFWSEVKVAQFCQTSCDLMDYTAHGILQARILRLAAFSPLGNLPNPGTKPRPPALQAVSLTTEPQEKPTVFLVKQNIYREMQII